jgi:hypothetical protein
MCSLDSSIAELYFNGMISREDAIAQAAYPGQAGASAGGVRRGTDGSEFKSRVEFNPQRRATQE